ncbi:LysR substrate-binding domain-containing protein [Rhizobium leguminosarum]
MSVRASILFATTWMAPLLPKFYALFPDIKIRLLAAVWADTSASVDVDIRFGDGQWSDFEVRPLWCEPSVLVARKDDTVLGCERERLLTLVQGGVVQIMGCEDRWRKILRKRGLDEAGLRVNTMTDNSLIALELTAAGFGPCIVQQSYTMHYLKERDLDIPLAEGIMINESHFVLTARSAERTAPEAVIFRDWLIAELKDAAV